MINNKYKDLYLSTYKSQLKKMADLLLALEKNTKSQNLIENIFRLIHSMKGAAATMGYKKTVHAFHAMENIIDSAYNQSLIIDEEVMDILIGSLEKFKQNIQTIQKTSKEINLQQQTTIFKNIVKKKNTKNKDGKKVIVKREKHILGSLPTVAEISVSIHKLNVIQYLLDDLMISTMENKSVIKKHGNSKMLSNCMRMDEVVNNLRREFEKLRIVPLAQIFSSLPFLVREIAKNEGKEAELIIEDNDLALDKSILDELIEILIQLLKNAVAHGISKDQKNGRINLEARLDGEMMKVIVQDNGQGIDWQKIMDQAVKHRIISKAKAKKLTVKEVKGLIFSPGISSGKSVSISSGRGVGLSLVKDKVAELKGSVEVDSVSKKGTSFTITLPLPLSIFRSIVFSFKEHALAVPLSIVEKIVKLEEVKDFKKSKFFVDNRKKYKLIY
ncbi:hypothetical protein HN859_04505, partial [Candidatus Parcubacteria bacterium]|nr:hypothetical protein [Candidatus Parcubacteria bacterium]